MDLQPRLRSAITLVVLTIILLLGLVWGWTKMTEPVPSLSGGGPTAPVEVCTVRTVAKGTKVTAAAVTVSVFNAGNKDGLATRTMDQLEARGFAPGEKGNAPATASVKNVQIWADDPRNPAVRLVRSQLGRSVKVVAPRGAPLGVGVVVVVGDGFNKLVTGLRFVRAPAAVQICSPN